jgi:hypothetical protein
MKGMKSREAALVCHDLPVSEQCLIGFFLLHLSFRKQADKPGDEKNSFTGFFNFPCP